MTYPTELEVAQELIAIAQSKLVAPDTLHNRNITIPDEVKLVLLLRSIAAIPGGASSTGGSSFIEYQAGASADPWLTGYALTSDTGVLSFTDSAGNAITPFATRQLTTGDSASTDALLVEVRDLLGDEAGLIPAIRDRDITALQRLTEIRDRTPQRQIYSEIYRLSSDSADAIAQPEIAATNGGPAAQTGAGGNRISFDENSVADIRKVSVVPLPQSRFGGVLRDGGGLNRFSGNDYPTPFRQILVGENETLTQAIDYEVGLGVSGTGATAGATVEASNSGVVIGSAIVGDDGAWDIQPATLQIAADDSDITVTENGAAITSLFTVDHAAVQIEVWRAI